MRSYPFKKELHSHILMRSFPFKKGLHCHILIHTLLLTLNVVVHDIDTAEETWSRPDRAVFLAGACSCRGWLDAHQFKVFKISGQLASGLCKSLQSSRHWCPCCSFRGAVAQYSRTCHWPCAFPSVLPRPQPRNSSYMAGLDLDLFNTHSPAHDCVTGLVPLTAPACSSHTRTMCV